MGGPTVEEVAGRLPRSRTVAVVMERRPAASPWADETWEATGILSGPVAESRRQAEKIHEQGGVARFLHPGFLLQLHEDECESYYHNLMTPRPRCFVVARADGNEAPVPQLVTLSFDEAHAYLEAGESVYAVDIPPDIYRWCEAYVLAHYVPERKYKRRLSRQQPMWGGR